jgi:1-acyl-sn-glycerol-3-phosphate acyltransferase
VRRQITPLKLHAQVDSPATGWYSLRLMGHTVVYLIRLVSQFILFSICKIVIVRGKHASSIPDFNKNSRIVIASNHTHALDPFAVVSSIRYRDFFRLAPFAFMTSRYFFKMRWLRPMLWLAGCFPAHALPPFYNLVGIDAALAFLNRGYTLFIFPEGTRAKNGPLPAKRGVSEILQQVPNHELILAHIEWKRNPGAVIHLAKHTGSTDDPQAILNAIYKL